MEVLKSNSSAFFSVEASILVPFVYLQNHDVEKNITKKRFGKGIATLQATKISHQTGKRKKHRPKVSAFGCDGIRDRFQGDPGTSQRLVPKGNVTKPQQRICFSGHLHGYGTGSIEVLERRWWLSGVVGDCVFFSFLKKHQPSWKDEM